MLPARPSVPPAPTDICNAAWTAIEKHSTAMIEASY
jgi:hypothetical protein